MVCDWAAVSAQLGTELPDGYRSFCERWGRVQIDRRLTIEAPADDARAGLVGFVRSHNDVHRDLREDRGKNEALWPEPDGLLPWAYFEDGTTVLWQTAGEPDAWTVVLRRDDEEAGDWGEVTATGSQTLAFLAEWVAPAARRAPLEVRFIEADRTAWMGGGDPLDVWEGAEREGDHWRCFLNLGEVLQQPRDVALDGFLGHLAKRRPRLRAAIIDTRVRHAQEQLVVSGGWLGRHRCDRIFEAAIRYARHELRHQRKQ
ncbi:MAG: hypothetical protein Q8K79_21775 [Solirubrobacteraceae bacterium]|nr:hypothetical protein [Solirubrobacteraceae bacterium]